MNSSVLQTLGTIEGLQKITKTVCKTYDSKLTKILPGPKRPDFGKGNSNIFQNRDTIKSVAHTFAYALGIQKCNRGQAYLS